ncbi:39600_t:CDS:2, partial [Gigaspora margarita]
NEYTLEESKKWWLPEKSDCVALDPNLWSGSLKKNGARLVVFSSDICTNDNETGELAKDLISIVTVLIGTAQWTYNQCLIAVKRRILETPYDIRDKAMNDLLKEYKSNCAANRTNFKMNHLVINHLGEFYLCMPEPLEIWAEKQGPLFQKIKKRVIALDPGICTFMTGYDPSGY